MKISYFVKREKIILYFIIYHTEASSIVIHKRRQARTRLVFFDHDSCSFYIDDFDFVDSPTSSNKAGTMFKVVETIYIEILGHPYFFIVIVPYPRVS